MNDPLIARFAEACGATAPLDLRVDLAGGGLLAEGSVNQPFTLVGRDDSCDVTLSDPEINLRHAWLQVLGGRLFAVDLGSRTGLIWPGGARGPGWLDVGTSTKIGPFLLRLNAPITDKPSGFSPNYNPLVADTAAKVRPPVALEFRNGKRAKDRWAVNRLLTLVGRAPDCKIHLTADDISPYHCGLVSTRTGLWVVDLSGRGVVVNGERMRVSPLPHGAELWIGRFLISCQYQAPTAQKGNTPCPTPPSGSGRLAPVATLPRATTKLPPPPPRSLPSPTGPSDAKVPATPRPTEDEVELGTTSELDGDLPSSHILADAFRLWGGPNTSGPPSNPILVSGSGPSSGGIPITPRLPFAGLLDDSGTDTSDDWSVVPVFRQMADLHGRMSTEFQQWLTLMTQLFGRLKREHLSVVQRELNLIEDLTVEIAVLQSEVSRQALEQAAADRSKPTTPPPTLENAKATKPGADQDAARTEPWVPPSSRTPIPDSQSFTRQPGATSPTQQPLERLHALQQERAARWQAVITLFTEV